MKRRKKNFHDNVPASVLIPGTLQRAIERRAIAEERSFSAVIRMALKKELGLPLEESAEELEAK